MARTLPFRNRFVAAHRGCAGDGACENTLASFERAVALGADVIELDVRRLANDVLIVFHDGDIDTRPLGTMTRHDLERLVPDRAVPSLADVAEALAGRVQLDVELKDPGIERAAIETLIRAGWSAERLVVTSFDLAALDEVRRVWPAVAIGWLTEDDADAAIGHVAAGRLDFAAPHVRVLSPVTLDRCRDEDVPVVAWTVNDPGELSRLLRSPAVRGVITDRLSLALEIRLSARICT